MDFEGMANDDRAVSPVIGVILMVAITVILAAVIGTFVLGLGDQVQSTTPQASFGFDFEAGNTPGFDDTADGDTVTITHESGSSIEAGALSVVVSGSNGFTVSDVTTNSGHVDSSWSDPVSAGSSVVITETSGEYLQSGETVRVIYSNPNSDSTSTLASKQIP